MRDDQQSRSLFAELSDPVEALVLEIGIAHGQRLIDDQHVGPHRGGDAEGDAHLHAAGIGAHRLVEVVADLGECLDLRQDAFDVGLGMAHQAGGMATVLAPAQVRIEAHAQFEDRGDPAGRRHPPLVRSRRAGDQLEQRALARAVLADDAHGLTAAQC